MTLGVSLQRRALLQALGSASLLSACCTAPLERIVESKCATHLRTCLDAVPPDDVPIAIDAHCHIFNGHDADAEGYIRGPIANDLESEKLCKLVKLAAKPVAEMICSVAPNAAQEYDELCRCFSASRSTSKADTLRLLEDSATERRKRTRDQFAEQLARRLYGSDFKARYRELVLSANAKSHGIDASTAHFSADEILGILDYSERNPAGLMSTLKEKGVDPSGVFRLALRLASYRLDNLDQLMKTYGQTCEGVPKVAVFLPAMVEFNHWLGKAETGAVLEDQIKLMEMLALVTGGRALPIAAYNPWTDVATARRHSGLIKAAIMRGGCIGVKIYPSAGFRPIENREDKLCKLLPPPVTPGALNAALTDFFAWCTQCCVPVMVHTGYSRASCEAALNNTEPAAWEKLLTANDGLPLHLGHFGGDNKFAQADRTWAKAYLTLMKTTNGANVYADVGFWDTLLDGNDESKRFLRGVLSDERGRRRLMYGSDYQMLVFDSRWKSYPQSVFNAIDNASLGREAANVREAFFFGNAVRLYGLHHEGAARKRLEEFFRKGGNDVHLSSWFKRADALGL